MDARSIKSVALRVYVLLSYRFGHPEDINLVEQPAGIVLKDLKVRESQVCRRKSEGCVEAAAGDRQCWAALATL